MASITLRNSVLKIKDGSGTPNSLTVKIGDGNLTWSEKRNVEYKLNRGLVDEVRLGDDIPMDVRFDFVWDFLKSDTGEPVTIEEALKKTGAAVAILQDLGGPKIRIGELIENISAQEDSCTKTDRIMQEVAALLHEEDRGHYQQG